MNPEIFADNLAQLQRKDPELADAVRSVPSESRYIVSPSKKGPPSLSRNLPDGNRITLHSSYDPVIEAERFVNQCEVDKHTNFIVPGIGLGYHIQELIQRVPGSSTLIIFEKEMAGLYRCLANVDFTAVIAHPGVRFHIGVEAPELESLLEKNRIGFALNGYATVKFKPLVNAEIEYFAPLLKKVDAIINETQVDLKTQAAFSKIFYRNIFANWTNIISSPGVHPLKNKYAGLPAIIVSAGPSLDKNIALLKKSANRVLIIAVATALRPLIKNNIDVDFVVAVDPDESTLQFFDFDKIPNRTWLVFDPCVPCSVVNKFPGKRIRIDSGACLSRWLASKQGEDNFLGKTLSVAHAAFLLARYLGCSPIILTGQDLSFTQNRLHCRDSHYDQLRKDKISAGHPLRELEDNQFHEFSASFQPVRNIFGKDAVTTTALKTYKDVFVDKVDGHTAIYNATEGGLCISGVPNVTLREAINSFCTKTDRPRIHGGAVPALKPDQLKGMISELIEQANRFDKIVLETRKIQSACLSPRAVTDAYKKEFVERMDTFYRFLMDQPDTLMLMQGYSYMGFIEWNQENGRILLKEDGGREAEILEDKFKRDKKFIVLLEKTATALRVAFKKMAHEME
jgi:hypothetical protein